MISLQGFRLISGSSSFQSQAALPVGRFGAAGGGGLDAGPARDEFIVGAGVFGLAEAFAEGVEAVGELADGFSFAAERGEECAGGGFATLFQGADELVQGFPDRGAGVGARVPIGGIFGPLEESDFTAAALENAGLLHAVHARAFAARERVSITESAFAPAVLLEPMKTKLGVGVEIVLGEEAVDELEGGADAHGRAVGLQHGGVFGEDGHARPDDGLREVHRGDGRTLAARALGHLVERLGQHAVQLADELAAGNRGRIRRALAADEDDAGGKGVGVSSNHTIPNSVRIGHVPLMVSPRESLLREMSPSRCLGAPVASHFRLLESIINGDGKCWMCLLRKPVHRVRHSVEKKPSAFSCHRGDEPLRLTPQLSAPPIVAKSSGKISRSERRSHT